MPSINATSSALLSLYFGDASFSQTVRRSALPPSAVERQRGVSLRQLSGAVAALRSSLERVAKAAGPAPVAGPGRVEAPRAATRGSLSLDVITTPTTFRSTEEVNTTPTSFSPFGPTIDGDSTAEATVGGLYDGDQGDDVLTFTIRDNATVGSGDRLRVRVKDGSGNTIGNFNFRNKPAGFVWTLSNGLEVSFGAGDVDKNDTFQVAVSTSVGSSVDPTKVFDGVRNDDPNFEAGLAVAAGSFEVNGETIAVAADDSIDSVLAKINASAAGVDATFDVASEQVVLTQRIEGPESTIVVGNDSSGFLAATKLAGATQVLGRGGGTAETNPLMNLVEFESVSAGAIRVNGVSVAIDPTTDRLADVLSRIESTVSGVRARFDEPTGQVVVESLDGKTKLELADEGSGFLAAARIDARSYERRVIENPTRVSDPLRNELTHLERALNEVLSGAFPGVDESRLGRVRSSLEEIVRGAFKDLLGIDTGDGAARSELGIDFFFGSRSDRGVFRLDMDRLGRLRGDDFVDLHGFLFGTEADEADPSSQGLVGRLVERARSIEAQLSGVIGYTEQQGRLVDLLA